MASHDSHPARTNVHRMLARQPLLIITLGILMMGLIQFALFGRTSQIASSVHPFHDEPYAEMVVENELMDTARQALFEARRNVHRLLQLDTHDALKTVVLDGHFNADCWCPLGEDTLCKSLQVTAWHTARELDQLGYKVSLLIPSGTERSECMHDDFLDLLRRNPYNPDTVYDIRLCVTLARCLTAKARFTVMVVPWDSTGMNFDERNEQIPDDQRWHLSTFQLHRQFSNIVLGPSATQITAYQGAFKRPVEEWSAQLFALGTEDKGVRPDRRSYGIYHHGVNLDDFHFVERTPFNANRPLRFGFLGGWFGPRKGLRELLAAFSLAFADKTIPVELCLSLSGMKPDDLLDWELFQQYGNDGRILWDPRTSRSIEEIMQFYSSIDVFVELSQFEGFGLPPLEAMATGAATILHDWSGLKDICGPTCCLPVRSLLTIPDAQWPSDGIWQKADIGHAAQLMRYAAIHPDRMLEMGRRAAKWVEKHWTWHEVTRAVFGRKPEDIKFRYWGCVAEKESDQLVELLSRRNGGVGTDECYQRAKAGGFRVFVIHGRGLACSGVKSYEALAPNTLDFGRCMQYMCREAMSVVPEPCGGQDAMALFDLYVEPPPWATQQLLDTPTRDTWVCHAMRPDMLHVMAHDWTLRDAYPTGRVEGQGLPAKSWCFPGGYDKTKLKPDEAIVASFMENSETALEQLASAPVGGWQMYDYFFPITATGCMPLQRYGGAGDGSKATCGDMPTENCVVYSFGSNNVWGFEEDMLARTQCEVHTFDCTQPREFFQVPTNDTRLHFHHLCLGGKDETRTGAFADTLKGAPAEFLSLSSILERLGHADRPLSLFKMDIEGSEYEVFVSMLRDAGFKAALPEQINFELHVSPDPTSMRTIERLSWDLFALGYRVIAVDLNYSCGGCADVSLVRLFE